MISRRTRFLRFLLGAVLVVAILAAAFALVLGRTHTWGATGEEAARVLPGDELAVAPILSWTHGATIDVPPETVWPWIAQIGDDRAAFYSYTFIENLIVGEDLYNNANEIVPQWQDPQPGVGLIGDLLTVNAVQPGRYMLASLSESGLTWTWLWHVEPQGTGQTRLLVRMNIETPPAMTNSLVTGVIDLGGFVMERRMIEGIVDRAEGRTDLPYSESLEIAVWVVALLAGLAAARLFLVRPDWGWPLAVGVAAVLILVALTFLQPPTWLRLVLDLALLAGLWRAGRAGRHAVAA